MLTYPLLVSVALTGCGGSKKLSKLIMSCGDNVPATLFEKTRRSHSGKTSRVAHCCAPRVHISQWGREILS